MAAVGAGNAGQVEGAVNAALPDAAGIAAAISMFVAQWCAPRRRQHAGRRVSSLAPSVGERGPKPNKNMKTMESARRIWNS